MNSCLTDLLCDLFSGPGLRRFVAAGEQGEAIAVNLPGADVSRAQLADAVVEQLRQRGLVAVTLHRLHFEFPYRAVDIEHVAREWNLMLEGTSDFILPRARKRQGHSSAIRLVGLSLIANGMMEMASITVAFSTGNMPEAAMGLFTGIHPVIASIDIVLGIALLVRAQPLLLTIISTFLMLQMIAIFLLGIAHQQSLVITLGGLLYVPLLALIIWRHSANKNTVILAAIPLLVYFVASTFIAFKLASEALPSTALSGPKGADGSRTIMGKSGYHIRLPDDGWRLVSSDFIEQRNTQIDLLISHSETSSLVSTFDLPVMQGSQEIDDTTDVLLASAREGLTNFIVRGREPFVGYPKNGRLIHLAGTLNGTDVEGWMLVMSSEGHLYQVNARTLRQNFPSFGSTLRSVVESFALPGASRDAAAQ